MKNEFHFAVKTQIKISKQSKIPAMPRPNKNENTQILKLPKSGKNFTKISRSQSEQPYQKQTKKWLETKCLSSKATPSVSSSF